MSPPSLTCVVVDWLTVTARITEAHEGAFGTDLALRMGYLRWGWVREDGGASGYGPLVRDRSPVDWLHPVTLLLAERPHVELLDVVAIADRHRQFPRLVHLKGVTSVRSPFRGQSMATARGFIMSSFSLPAPNRRQTVRWPACTMIPSPTTSTSPLTLTSCSAASLWKSGPWRLIPARCLASRWRKRDRSGLNLGSGRSTRTPLRSNRSR